MKVVKFLYNVATLPMYLNVYNLADIAVKGINKISDMETSKVVNVKEFETDSVFVESTVC